MNDLGKIFKVIADVLSPRIIECSERKSDYALVGPGK